MPLSDKNIVITPNIGQTADPKIAFVGANTLTSATITLNVYPTGNGTVSFEGSAGQLFSISNSFTGTIFSVNDVSGIPSIEVSDTGTITMAQYSGFVQILSSTSATSTTTGALRVTGGAGFGGALYAGGKIYSSGAEAITTATINTYVSSTPSATPTVEGKIFGYASSSTTFNSALGFNAGNTTQTGAGNVAIGCAALVINGLGNDNIAVGRGALTANVSGCNNIAIGRNALCVHNCSNNIIAVGYGALRSATGVLVSDNIAIGRNAMCSLCFCENNIAIGANAMALSVSGAGNVAIGICALACITTGCGNTVIGACGLRQGRRILSTVAVGCNNMAYGCFSNQNVLLGNDVLLPSNAYQSQSVFIGHSAGRWFMTGASNVAVGYNAMCGVAYGAQTSGQWNVAIGNSAMGGLIHGCHQIGIGCQALNCSRSGCHNIAIGSLSMNAVRSGCYNIAIGYGSLSNHSSGDNNIAIGCLAGCAITTGNSNTIIGLSTGTPGLVCTVIITAGACERIRVDNTGLCINGALFSVSQATPTSLGTVFGYTTGLGNNSIGCCAGSTVATGCGNTAIGCCTLNTAGFGCHNAAIGFGAMDLNTSGSNNTAIGYNALCTNTSGCNNLAVGYQSLTANSTGNDNVAIGYQSLFSNSFGNSNVAIGYTALYSNTTGNANIAIGCDALFSNSTGACNIAIGLCAGCNITTGCANTIIGMAAATSGMTSTVIISAGTCERIKVDVNGLCINGALVGGGATITNTTTNTATFYVTMACSVSGTLSTAYVTDSKLYFVPCSGTLNATVFNTLSDCRKKTNITGITCALEIVNKIDGVEFDWTETGEKSAGVIAQQIETVLPHLVNTDPKGNKSVNYQGIIGYLIETVKELEQRVSALEAKSSQ